MGPGSPPPKPAWSASGKCHVGPVLTHQKSPLPAKQWLPGLIRITHPRDRLCRCGSVQVTDARWTQGRRRPVPKEGLEPSHPKAQEPKSCVSTSSTTLALFNCFAPLSADRPSEARSVFDASLPSVQIFQLQVSLELVDVAGGLDIVLSYGDGSVALLVDVDDEGRADDPLDELAVEQLLPVRAVGVERRAIRVGKKRKADRFLLAELDESFLSVR